MLDHTMPLSTLPRRLWTSALLGGSAALLIGCAPLSTPSSAPSAPPAAQPGTPDSGSRPTPGSAPGPSSRPQAPRVSATGTPLEYRRDAATHLYAINADRIFAGKLPHNLYAIGVLEVDLDGQGQVRRLHWLRAPSHAPEVVREIEKTVRAAAPFPAPARMGKVRYVDTWLWDKSGRFQLDTLTEGQH
jgi:protein TonB